MRLIGVYGRKPRKRILTWPIYLKLPYPQTTDVNSDVWYVFGSMITPSRPFGILEHWLYGLLKTHKCANTTHKVRSDSWTNVAANEATLVVSTASVGWVDFILNARPKPVTISWGVAMTVPNSPNIFFDRSKSDMCKNFKSIVTERHPVTQPQIWSVCILLEE